MHEVLGKVYFGNAAIPGTAALPYIELFFGLKWA